MHARLAGDGVHGLGIWQVHDEIPDDADRAEIVNQLNTMLHELQPTSEILMTKSSILGGADAPRIAAGKDVDALGPSDTSDSGSDVQGERAMSTAPDNAGEWGAVVIDTETDTDATGTGERASADGDAPRDGADILPDRIVDDLGLEGDPADWRRSAKAADLAGEVDDTDAGDDATNASR
jgi:hypothetical protein